MANSSKTIVFITGANSGIGFELTAQLLNDPSKHVLLGSRSIEKGEAAIKDLKSRNLPGTVELIQINVADEESIIAAAEDVDAKHGRLDVLVNNAAIALPTGTMFQQLIECFRTNVAGVCATVEAFAPLLSKSANTPRIINVTSGLGSIGHRLDPTSPFYEVKNEAYRASKAALNMVTACQTVEYEPKGWKVLLFCPGFTESNLGPLNKVAHGAKPTSEPVRMMVGLVNGDRDGDQKKFLQYDIGECVW